MDAAFEMAREALQLGDEGKLFGVRRAGRYIQIVAVIMSSQ